MKFANGEYKYYFLDYCKTNIRFDKFLGLYIDRKKFDKLWNICKLTFILSHEQAAVEKGLVGIRKYHWRIYNKNNWLVKEWCMII